MYNTCIMYYYSIQNVWKVPFLFAYASIIQSCGIACNAAFIPFRYLQAQAHAPRIRARTHENAAPLVLSDNMSCCLICEQIVNTSEKGLHCGIHCGILKMLGWFIPCRRARRRKGYDASARASGARVMTQAHARRDHLAECLDKSRIVDALQACSLNVCRVNMARG